jgi:hypothetical protein
MGRLAGQPGGRLGGGRLAARPAGQRMAGLADRRTAGLAGGRTAGLADRRTAGLADQRTAGLAGRLRQQAERGSAALFVAIFAPAMIFMAGLVIDGGAALEAKQRASDIAEQAARAGAGQCDVALLRSQGICFVDKGLVPAAVAPYRTSPGVTDFDWVPLADPNHPGQDNGVRVTVTMTFRTTLLGIMPKFKTLTITERADAVAVTGL